MSDDAQLIEATLAGQATAFGQLVTRYQDRVYHAVVQVTGSTEDARDVVQDAFVQAFVKLKTFRGSSAFYTWLYRIAINLAISHCRRRRNPTVSIERSREATGSEPADPHDGPTAVLEQNDRVTQVQQALASLSDEHRTILVLREMEDCSYETIADMLDLPIGTVRSRLHRARLQLKDELRKVMQEEVG
ncbi:MAG: sigma-70 family RNA polymerase sigma factor [Planctomycetales bacterium]|nr:sigma-70 family RNA polymerase sigma factor [Planctomycetales bacterium]NIM08058.1 sigma-70 family RNA polymerase sigma factor [Planctomycetales bacterium]NIN07549.1 sigma-70 family RNA polymerase sigma factor [Planctomycetales bacterium]NIN76656.1 sigma-70 family RNA polymerase sigma factor [Planctomycetales bacterium]NIO33844.1 sigma-70 family RNA polymerase sigma factor [Planctomycetales bacterium]